MSEHEVSQLVAILERKLGTQFPAPKPGLSVVKEAAPQRRCFDSITRASHIDRIRYLSRGYGLSWLVEQATFDRPGLDCLEDDELIQLHRDMDKALDCIRDGVAFEDADLVRRLSNEGDFYEEADDWGDSGYRLVG